MNPHEEWLRKNNLGYVVDDRPIFLKECRWLESKLDEDTYAEMVCPVCPYLKECNSFFKSLADAMERFNEIGEV